MIAPDRSRRPSGGCRGPTVLLAAWIATGSAASGPAASRPAAPGKTARDAAGRKGPIPARQAIDPAEVPGERPYEMARADRREPRTPLLDFEDLRGWTAEGLDGGRGLLSRSREQTVWGDAVGKLVYRGRSARSRILLRPPGPIPIPTPFDAADLWCHGNNWGWAPDPTTPSVRLGLLLRAAAGREVEIPLGTVRWKEWWLVHKRIPAATREALGPAPRFAGLAVSGAANREDRTLYFDSLAFYREALPALSFAPRPRRNLTLFPGQDPGLNTGPGRLPFPTREETILPSNICPRYRNRAKALGGDRFAFLYEGDDGRVAYELDAGRADFSTLVARVDGRAVLRPLVGAGVDVADAAGPARTISARLEEGVLRWIQAVPLRGGGSAEIAYALRIRGKSLLLDACARGGRATALRFGRFEDLREPVLITVPYITYGRSRPPVLMARDETGRAIFAAIWLDWYRSNGSEPFASPGIEAGGRAARVNGGVRYIPRTDGRRNELFERAFLTVSPIFEEVLPTIANPPSPDAREAGSRLWQESWGPSDYAKEGARSRRLRAHGIARLTQCNHEITWRDGGESFTLRLRAAPGKGGDEALKRYIAGQKALGWRAGLYTNYTDFAPVNAHWDPDAVQRTPDGDWRPAWPRCYALKPARAVEFDRRLAPRIHATYASDAAYTDVHTAAAPWAYCDYDARVPGAGTFAQTFYLYGEILLHDRSVYGPTWSEGTYQWLYAGLASGNYGLCYGGPNLSAYPLLPVFDLLKIHPLECDIGMPWTAGFFGGGPWSAPDRIEASIDHFIAATIAYGHIGWLVEEAHGIRRTCRSYYHLQALQSRYAQVPVREIRYAAPRSGRLASVSEALAGGFWRAGRLAIAYAKGLRVFVNGDASGCWAIEPPGPAASRGPIVLPPWGWYAAAEGFRSGLALERGRRVDRAVGSDYVYLDGRGAEASLPEGLQARGGVAVRREGDGFELIDIGGNDWIGFGGGEAGAGRAPGDVRAFLARPVRPGGLGARAWGADGEARGTAEIRAAAHRYWLRPVAGAVRYALQKAEAPAPRLTIDGPGVMVPGGEARVRVRCAGPAGAKARVRLAVEGESALRVAGAAGRAVSFGDHGWAEASFRVTLGGIARVGERIWLRADGGEGPPAWHPIAVVPLLAARPMARSVRLPRAEIEVALWAERDAVEVAVEGPAWLAAEPARFAVAGQEVRAMALREIEPPAPGPGEIVLRARAGSLSGRATLSFRAERVRPVAVDLAKARVPLVWTTIARGGPERPGDPATGACFRREASTCGGRKEPGFFSHPPYRGGVGAVRGTIGPVAIPRDPAVLEVLVGIRDGGDPSDGVIFSAAIRPSEGGAWAELVRVHANRSGWRPVSCDLEPWAGRRVLLRLEADVGPVDDSTSDWAAWGRPSIRLRDPVTRLIFADPR